jgi:hypothetical protein
LGNFCSGKHWNQHRRGKKKPQTATVETSPITIIANFPKLKKKFQLTCSTVGKLGPIMKGKETTTVPVQQMLLSHVRFQTPSPLFLLIRKQIGGLTTVFTLDSSSVKFLAG